MGPCCPCNRCFSATRVDCSSIIREMMGMFKGDLLNKASLSAAECSSLSPKTLQRLITYAAVVCIPLHRVLLSNTGAVVMRCCSQTLHKPVETAQCRLVSIQTVTRLRCYPRSGPEMRHSSPSDPSGRYSPAKESPVQDLVQLRPTNGAGILRQIVTISRRGCTLVVKSRR